MALREHPRSAGGDARVGNQQGTRVPEIALRPPTERTQWLEWRRGGLGGSDAGAIAGLDPWRSALAVWLDKRGHLPLQGEETEWQRMGHRLQQPVIEEFEFRTGLYVAGQQLQLEHIKHPWMRATIDGLVGEGSFALQVPEWSPDELIQGALGILEIKTASWRSPVNWKDGTVPDHVALQIQHNLEVAQLDHAWLVVLLNGQELVIHELERDEAVIAALLELEEDFWARVQENRPPPADERPETSEALREAYSAPEPASVLELEAEQLSLVRGYAAARDVLKAAEQEQRLWANKLMALLGEREIGLHGDEQVVTWKRLTAERVDLEALRKHDPELVRRFTRTQSQRRLHVPAPTEENP